MRWNEVINYLQQFHATHPSPGDLTGLDVLNAVDLYLKLTAADQGGPAVDMNFGTIHNHANMFAARVSYPANAGRLIVTAALDNAIDLVVIQPQYQRFRNIVIKQNDWGTVTV